MYLFGRSCFCWFLVTRKVSCCDLLSRGDGNSGGVDGSDGSDDSDGI